MKQSITHETIKLPRGKSARVIVVRKRRTGAMRDWQGAVVRATREVEIVNGRG